MTSEPESQDRPRAAPRRWYAAGVRFQCTRSGKCCRAHGEYDRVYLNDDEARAIADHLEIDVAELERRHCRSEDGLRVLRFRDGACPMLVDGQCGVYEARPVQCRTWPFWRENLQKRVWDREVAPFCAGVGRGPVHSAEEIERLADLADE